MKAYLDLLQDVKENGIRKEDRTGTGTLSVFGRQLRFDLSKGFPAVTTKKLFFKGVKAELLWFLKGSTNVKWLQEQGVHIWDEWADEDGELGPVYGKQWRAWPAPTFEELAHEPTFLVYDETIDQLAKVIETLKTNPNSRRMVISAWNVADLPKMALEPCHVLFQFYVTPEKPCQDCQATGTVETNEGNHDCYTCDGTGKNPAKLSCQLYQRSADLFLGVPFNIASYALLTHMIAQVCDLEVGEFIHTFGDVHIYLNHLNQVREQLWREPSPLPNLWLNPKVKDIDHFTMEDIELRDYQPYPSIPAPVAV